MRQDAGVDGDAQRISQLCWMFFLKILDDQDQQLELIDSATPLPFPERLRWRTWAANPEGITGDELLGFINNDLFPTLKELAPAGASITSEASCPVRLRGRLQLHEVGTSAPPGRQQDQLRSTSTTSSTSSTSAMCTSKFSTTSRVPETQASTTRHER